MQHTESETVRSSRHETSKSLMVVLDLGTTGMMDDTKQQGEEETQGIFALTTSAVLLSTL